MTGYRAPAPIGVLVGFDGTAEGEQVVRRAAAEALHRRTSLTVVGVAEGDGHAETRTRALVRQVHEEQPTLVVSAQVEAGGAADVLGGLSARAALLVLGSAGLPGPTARPLLDRAACPLMLVPVDSAPAAPPQRRRLVVAAVRADGSAAAVLQAAITEANRAGGRVRLVHRYAPRPTGLGQDPARLFCSRLVRDVARGRRGVTSVVTGEDLSTMVARHAAEADLLVVAGGAPRRPGPDADLPRAVLEAAAGPVLVVPPAVVVRLAGTTLPQPRAGLPVPAGRG
jgi:hypothetical protein